MWWLLWIGLYLAVGAFLCGLAWDKAAQPLGVVLVILFWPLVIMVGLGDGLNQWLRR